MERKVTIVLNEEEKMALREAGRVMEKLCDLADTCTECPLQRICKENTTDGCGDLGVELQKI